MLAEPNEKEIAACDRPVSHDFLHKMSPRQPRLLVSVRSVIEATTAIGAGAEILDVKEPSVGSLGMASVREIESIAKLSPIAAGTIPMSIALGEVADWLNSASVPCIPSAVTFAKLGLSRLAQDANWLAHWKDIRARFEQHSESRIGWVAVAYADAAEANSPCVFDILQAAIHSKCAGLLVDTWTKNGRTLLDSLDRLTLTTLAQDCHAAGLFFALAGNIGLNSLPELSDVPANIIAIRSAACRKATRTSEIEESRIVEFRTSLNRYFAISRCEEAVLPTEP